MSHGTRWTKCTTQREDGSFCDATTIPDAPFPICVRHAAQLFSFLSHTAEVKLTNGFLDLALYEIRKTEAMQMTDRAARSARRARQQGQIYYLRVGDLVKVGYTADLRQRLRDYPPDAKLLAVEPGTRTHEAQLHRKFRHLLAGRAEWYRAGLDLMHHIAAVRDRTEPARRPA